MYSVKSIKNGGEDGGFPDQEAVGETGSGPETYGGEDGSSAAPETVEGGDEISGIGGGTEEEEEYGGEAESYAAPETGERGEEEEVVKPDGEDGENITEEGDDGRRDDDDKSKSMIYKNQLKKIAAAAPKKTNSPRGRQLSTASAHQRANVSVANRGMKASTALPNPLVDIPARSSSQLGLTRNVHENGEDEEQDLPAVAALVSKLGSSQAQQGGQGLGRGRGRGRGRGGGRGVGKGQQQGRHARSGGKKEVQSSDIHDQKVNATNNEFDETLITADDDERALEYYYHGFDSCIKQIAEQIAAQLSEFLDPHAGLHGLPQPPPLQQQEQEEEEDQIEEEEQEIKSV